MNLKERVAALRVVVEGKRRAGIFDAETHGSSMYAGREVGLSGGWTTNPKKAATWDDLDAADAFIAAQVKAGVWRKGQCFSALMI